LGGYILVPCDPEGSRKLSLEHEELPLMDLHKLSIALCIVDLDKTLTKNFRNHHHLQHSPLKNPDENWRRRSRRRGNERK
jgi:hypothetical protein